MSIVPRQGRLIACLALVVGASLACGSAPSDDDARSHLDAHRAGLNALCRQVASQSETSLPADRDPTPRTLRDTMTSLGVERADQGFRDWPPGVMLTIHTQGLGVSGSSTSLFCGERPPAPLVLDTRAATSGRGHGFVCAELEPDWFVCREWT